MSRTNIQLSTGKRETLILTASGGPVSWFIAEPSSLIATLTVPPASGTLAAGQSVSATLSITSLVAVDSHLTVNPGCYLGDDHGRPRRLVH